MGGVGGGGGRHFGQNGQKVHKSYKLLFLLLFCIFISAKGDPQFVVLVLLLLLSLGIYSLNCAIIWKFLNLMYGLYWEIIVYLLNRINCK